MTASMDDPLAATPEDEGALFDDKLREECAVAGVFGAPRAAAHVALGLHAMQHRGQESCGIISFGVGADPENSDKLTEARFWLERRPGLVGDGLLDIGVARRLPGDAAIGHVRYSTQGRKGEARNIQPLYADLRAGGVAIAHNGNITNARALREECRREGAIFQSTSDTEVVLHLMAQSDQAKTVDRMLEALRRLHGGYAFVALTNKKLMGARDPLGIRPLALGYLDGAPVLASESCALAMIGARFERDIRPGELIVIDADGVISHEIAPARAPRTCAFEYIYFARPDSVIDGVSVYEARLALGRQLADEHPVEADVVAPVPDSGMSAALGYSEQSGIPFALGIIRSHYSGRTFTQPSQEMRARGVRMKHLANAAAVRGKRVVLVDDSIVRGNTSKQIVAMIREAGAREVHFCSASPPIRYPDFYGIDMPDKDELLANKLGSIEAMAAFLKVDTLHFLSLDGMYRAITGAPKDPANPRLTDHYFTGEYPTPLVDRDEPEAGSGSQLSFLESAE